MREYTPEEAAAYAWWRSLSLNEQKAYAKEVLGSLWEYAWSVTSYIVEIFRKKAGT